MNIPFENRIIRYALSYLSKTGLCPKPDRPMGISAMVRVCDEAELIEASLLSIKDAVDEIVVVDTGSTDGTWEILQRLEKEIKNFRLFKLESRLWWDFSNFAVSRTRYRWIFKWDSDLVALAGAGQGMVLVRKKILELDPDIHYYINPTFIELAGDMGHQFPKLRIRRDIELFTYSPALKYVPVVRSIAGKDFPVKFPAEFMPDVVPIKFEGLQLPLCYRISSFAEVIGFHINIKSDRKCFLGYLQSQWLANGDFSAYPTLEDYAGEYAKSKWDMPDMASAAEFYMRAYAKSLVPYGESLGPIPENIKTIKALARYKVIYDNGAITGRKTLK